MVLLGRTVNRLPQEVAALYRESVDTGEHDDFRELSGLLFGAKDRYRSARVTISYTVVGAVAEESNRRFVDWRFAQGNPGMGIIGKPGPPQREDFYHEYEDVERVVRLWHERPDRWREERRTPQGALLGCVVAAGRHAPLWMYEPPEPAIHVPSVPERRDPDPLLAFMLDPSEEVVYHSLRDDATLRKTGRRTTVAGREALEVEVGTVSWGYPPRMFRSYYAPEGTTDHLLLVDAEVGTILRVAARLEGREFWVAEVTEIAYDEEFSEDTFRLEMPGVEFRRVVR
jgi:hypothetical protein